LNFEIRKAELKDIPEVFEMARTLAIMQELEHRFCITQESLKLMFTEPEQSTTTVVVEADNQILAFAMYTLLRNNRLYHNGFAMYVDELFVLPEHRSIGLGTALFQYIAKKALENNCNRMEWWVEKENNNAMTFYDNLGARSLDEFTTYRMLKPELEIFVNK
jgi:GNAT superfamily N-acetyltransferase